MRVAMSCLRRCTRPGGGGAAIRAAKRRLGQRDAAEGGGGGDRDEGSASGGDGETAPKPRLLELDTDAIIARSNGRDAGYRRLGRSWPPEEAQPIPRSRGARVREAAGRLEQDHAAQIEADEAYGHYRATERDTHGRRLSCSPKPYEPLAQPEGKITTTDPGLAADEHARASRPHRGTTRRRRSTSIRSSSRRRCVAARATSGISARWSRRPSVSCKRSASARPRTWLPMRVTGTQPDRGCPRARDGCTDPARATVNQEGAERLRERPLPSDA
jgi:hypothetical protein